MRIMTYGTFSAYSYKIINKIVDFSLKNYEDKNIFKKIEEA